MKIVGVRFRKEGKTFFFTTGSLNLKKGDYVVAHTDQGISIGQVVEGPYPWVDDINTMSQIERLATKEEIKKYFDNMRYESEAKKFCSERIKAHGLPMNLVGVEHFFDGSKIIFYFTADGRVDFRELLKDLVKRFRTRVELRQIGVRNHAKMIGGLGCCGRPLCCSTFLKTFHPISIKMVKEQNLSLNPEKISGVCGRLMCCLQFEYENYHESCTPKVEKKAEQETGDKL